MNYITSNTRYTNNNNSRQAVVIREVGTDNYGVKLFIGEDYLGIDWLGSTNHQSAVKYAKNFIFSSAEPALFEESTP